MRTKHLVLGATSAGIAYALSHADCLIAEKGMNLCVDYTDCMNIQRVDISALCAYVPEIRTLAARASDMNLLSADGALHPFPLIGLTAKALLEKKVPVLSFCEAETFTRNASGEICAKIFCADSHMEILTQDVIDATAAGDGALAAFCGHAPAKAKKAICASMRSKTAVQSFDLTKTARIIHGRFDDEYYLELALDDTDDYRAGYAKLHAFWQAHFADDALRGFEFIDAASELIHRTAGFSFVRLCSDAYRLTPDTVHDIFHGMDLAWRTAKHKTGEPEEVQP